MTLIINMPKLIYCSTGAHANCDKTLVSERFTMTCDCDCHTGVK